MQNIALVMQDPTSRQMLVDFAVKYYGSSSQVTRSELLGALPAELLIAAGTAGAGTAVKSAGIAERIGATLGELATALRAVDVRSPVIPYAFGASLPGSLPALEGGFMLRSRAAVGAALRRTLGAIAPTRRKK
jgi:hypothetical protein